MSALFRLRWRHFVNRTVRKAGNLRVYLHGQAVLIYLYAGATFLGGPIYYLLVPHLIPEPIRQTGGALLTLALVATLATAGYRALFSAADGFPSPIPIADMQFVLTAPLSRIAFLVDRLLWGLLQAAGQAALLIPLLWAFGRAFWSPWGWPDSVAGGALYIAVQMAVLATGLLLYGLPQPVVSVLRAIRAGLWGLGGLLGLSGLLLGPSLRSAGAALSGTPTPLSIGSALPPAASIIARALPAVSIWAVVAAALTLWLSRPSGERLAADASRAERQRLARWRGQSGPGPSGHGLARISLAGRWGDGIWAVAWRQLAAYRHLPPEAWPTKLLSLLAVASTPSLLQMLGGSGAASVAGGLPLLIPVMVGITVAAGLMGGWRHEVVEGWSRRLLPVRTAHVVVGFALWPGLAVGVAASIGLWFGAAGDLVTAISALPLALASGILIALLASHEEYLAAVSLTGPAEGRQAGKVASIILTGLPLLLAYELLPAFGPAITYLGLAGGVALESYGLVQYLAFRLASDRL